MKDNTIFLTKEEKEELYTCIWMRCNYIETGDVCMSAVDAKNMDKANKIKSLSIDQMKMFLFLKSLQKKLLDL